MEITSQPWASLVCSSPCTMMNACALHGPTFKRNFWNDFPLKFLTFDLNQLRCFNEWCRFHMCLFACPSSEPNVCSRGKAGKGDGGSSDDNGSSRRRKRSRSSRRWRQSSVPFSYANIFSLWTSSRLYFCSLCWGPWNVIKANVTDAWAIAVLLSYHNC